MFGKAEYVIEVDKGDGRWRAVAGEILVNGRWRTVTRWADKRVAQAYMRDLERKDRAGIYRVRKV